ncbi:hypothetical protein GCM10022243_57730 [Saccharothrix violaceirubra]
MIAPALVGIAALLGGCAAETGAPAPTTTTSPAPPGLVGALSRVKATHEGAAYVEYGDLAALRGYDVDRFKTVAHVGLSDLAPRGAKIADVTGFDPTAADTVLRVGQPPKWAGVLRMKVPVDAVNGKFEGLGAQREDGGGGTTWTTAKDNAVDLAGPFGSLGVMAAFNQVRVTPDGLFHAPSAETLGWFTAPGDLTLDRHPAVGPLARCLGDVVVAVIANPLGRLPVAAGVRVVDGVATDVLCGGAAGVDRVRDNVAAVAARPGAPAGIADAAVEADRDDLVRVVVPTGDGPVGRTVRMITTGDAASLFG